MNIPSLKTNSLTEIFLYLDWAHTNPVSPHYQKKELAPAILCGTKDNPHEDNFLWFIEFLIYPTKSKKDHLILLALQILDQLVQSIPHDKLTEELPKIHAGIKSGSSEAEREIAMAFRKN